MTRDEILSHPASVLTQQQREFYFDQGYVLLTGSLEEAWLSRLRAAAAELVERSRDPEQRTADFEFEDDRSEGAPRLRQILSAVDYQPDLWAYASEPPLTDVVSELVGPDVKFRESGVSFKPPGGGRGFPWHQGHRLLPPQQHDALDDSHVPRGCDVRDGPDQGDPGQSSRGGLRSL